MILILIKQNKMKNFQDFRATLKVMTPKEFNKKNNDDLDIGGTLYVYKDYFYINKNAININEFEHLQDKPFSLTIGNQYYESKYLRELEVKLYNDWFIDNIEGSEEWLPYIGVHSPNASALYYLMFKDEMGFDVEDISYANDSVDTLRLSINKIELFDVLLPNSANLDIDKEKFNTFIVHNLKECIDKQHINNKEVVYYNRLNEDSDGFLDEDGECFDNLENMQESFEWRFHQLARDYMSRVEAMNNTTKGEETNCSLDEFMIDDDVWNDFPNNHSIKRAYHYGKKNDKFMLLVREEGYSILKIWDEFKILGEDMLYGCLPINMFEDGVTMESKVNASLEKAKVLIEKRISNGLIPLDTNYLDFVELGTYFDTKCLVEDFQNDVDGESDLVDLINDYLEFDCSITWSANPCMGGFDDNGDVKEFTSPSVEEKLRLCRLANQQLKAQLEVKDSKITSQMKKINNLITK